MIQFPMTVAQPLEPAKLSGPQPDADVQGLVALLQTDGVALEGFPGELQALLLQLSPQTLHRLEGLLQGGMALPQAASAILGELLQDGAQLPKLRSGDSMGDYLQGAFARLLKSESELPTREELVGLAEFAGKQLREGIRAPTADSLLAVNARLTDNASPTWTALHATLQQPLSPANGVTAAAMSPQLASSLLDMGVPQPVGGRGWGAAVADRLMWMVQGEQQFAKLKLNPPNLGPLEVRISVGQDQQTSVTFLAPHAAVREALEAALPRLRDMFEQQSLQLVRADVGDPGARQGGRPGDPSGQGTRGQGTETAGEHPGDDPGQQLVHHARSLIDLFV